MGETNNSTLERIHAAAQAEFLKKGYQGASLRNIVKTAGVTTGALYGYYDSKEALFAALVDESYRHVLDCMRELLTYMDARRPIFHLILERAEGTPYAALIDQMVTLEVEATECYTQVLRSMGKTVPDIDRRLEHMLVTGMMNAYCEIIIHDMPIEDAQRYREELGDFYTAGWLKIMGQ